MKRHVVAALVCLALSACAARDTRNVRDGYVGSDLRRVAPARMQPLLERIGKQQESPWVQKRFPSYVWRRGKDGETRYIVFEGRPLADDRSYVRMVPGEDFVTIHLFDSVGMKLNTWTFSTGWRIEMKDARLLRIEELDADVITIETDPQINGRCVAKQCFAFSGDHLRFIRMEDPEGRLIGNIYSEPEQTLGISVKDVGKEEWLAFLRSGNPVDVLSALTFIGGFHMERHYTGLFSGRRNEGQERVLQELRASDEVMELVHKYLKSNSKWLRQAAELVVKGENPASLQYRFFDPPLSDVGEIYLR